MVCSVHTICDVGYVVCSVYTICGVGYVVCSVYTICGVGCVVCSVYTICGGRYGVWLYSLHTVVVNDLIPEIILHTYK